MNHKEYSELTKKVSPGSKSLKNCSIAFVVGGLICVLGQALNDIYVNACNMGTDCAATLVSVTLVTLSIIFTAFGLYQKLAKYAGAGTLVPITGFANAMSSPAIEFKTEGHVMGLGTKLFSIAGPVIVFGLVSGFVYGIILWIWSMI